MLETTISKCKICGGKSALITCKHQDDDRSKYLIMCNAKGDENTAIGCGLQTDSFDKTEDAIESWNSLKFIMEE